MSKAFIIDRIRIWGPVVAPFILFFTGIGLVDSDVVPDRFALWTLLVAFTTGLASVSVALYMMRRRARLIYGILETLVGLGAIFAAVINIIRLLDTQAEDLFIGQNKVVGAFLLAAAIYIVVRGLDNIGEGLPPDSKASRIWTAIFPTGQSTAQPTPPLE